MGATTTIEVEMTDPAQNFLIKPVYTYGDIGIIFCLLTLTGVVAWFGIKNLFKKPF
jgi:hypothetical protein